MNFTVSGPGIVVVTATVDVFVEHLDTDSEEIKLNLGSNTTDCYSGAPVWEDLAGSEARGGYPLDFGLVRTFTIASAGSYSYYVVGWGLTVGSDYAVFESSSMVGVYYPA